MDLFDLLEKFFRGIVYFLYNLVESAAAILRQPLRGPLRLYRLHVRAETRQIGGMTFLFLAFMALFWVLLRTLGEGLPGLDALAKEFGKASVNAPRLDFNSIWPNLLASLASTVIIDAILRLLLRWRLPGRRRYRQMLLGAGEYALLWMVLAAVSAGVLLGIAWSHDDRPEGVMQLIHGWAAVSLVAASYPAARIMRLWRARGAPAGWRTLAGMATLVPLFSVAVFVGLSLATDVLGRRASNAFFDYRTHVETLRCEVLPDRRIDLDAFVYIEDGAPRAFKAADFSLVFESIYGDPIGDPFGLDLAWRSSRASPYVTVSEGQPVVVELRTPKAVAIPDEASCRVDGWYVKTEGQALGFEGTDIPAVVDDGVH